jgi:hypothetical protein
MFVIVQEGEINAFGVNSVDDLSLMLSTERLSGSKRLLQEDQVDTEQSHRQYTFYGGVQLFGL